MVPINVTANRIDYSPYRELYDTIYNQRLNQQRNSLTSSLINAGAGAAEAAISSEWWKRRQWYRQSICQRDVQSDQTGRTFKNQPRAGESDGRSRWGNNLINLRR